MFYSLLAGTYCLASGIKVYHAYREGLSDRARVMPLTDVSVVELQKGHVKMAPKLDWWPGEVEMIGCQGVGEPRTIKSVEEIEYVKNKYGIAYGQMFSSPFIATEYHFKEAYLSGNILSPCRKTVAFQYAFKKRLPLSLTIFSLVLLPLSMYELSNVGNDFDDFASMIGIGE